MVHNLRNRNVCHTSPRSYQVQSRSGNAPHSTPISKQKKKQRRREQPNDFNNNHHLTLADVSTVEQMPQFTFDHIEEEITNSQSTEFGLDETTLNKKLHRLIDEYIFTNTYKNRSGVSLYRIKKSLEIECAYKPSARFSKSVSKYVVYSISTGKFQQITGRGAAGTFRLNRELHKNILVTLRKVSSHSHAIKKRASRISTAA